MWRSEEAKRAFGKNPEGSLGLFVFRPLARRGIGEPIPARSDALAVTGRVNMPEPEPVAGTEVTPQEQPPVVEPPKEPDVSHETVVLDDDKEPGGDSPEAIFARKVWRERREARAEAKTARDEAQRERDERIRAEEQLRAARETRSAEEETKVYTLAQVRQAVRDGRITEEAGDQYIQDTVIPYQIKQTLEVERRKAAEQQPQERAISDIETYKTEVPELKDIHSDTFKKVAIEYQRLIRERGMLNNFVTQAVAVENTLGKLSDIRKRGEVDRNTRLGLTPSPTDRGAGGAGAVASGKIDITKAPQTMVTSWDREGVDQATRERRYKIYLDLKARQSVR